MAYRPIYETAQRPAPGPLPEDLRFDMKMAVPQALLGRDQPDALATDLAAFANAAGGVLLVGAKENPPGVLEQYVTVDHATAMQVVEAYQRATKLCSPKPVFDARPLPLDAGFVVAVNVEPYAAPPIGVAQPNQAGEKWWACPVRRGNATHNLRPEELATIMEPRHRRISLVLQRIAPAPGDPHPKVQVLARAMTGQHFLWVMRVEAEASLLVLRRDTSQYDCYVPLDLVEAVWRHGVQGHLMISVRGRFQGDVFLAD